MTEKIVFDISRDEHSELFHYTISCEDDEGLIRIQPSYQEEDLDISKEMLPDFIAALLEVAGEPSAEETIFRKLANWLMGRYLVKTGDHYKIEKEHTQRMRNGLPPEEDWERERDVTR